MKIDVLDKGYIEVVDTLGDDLTPVMQLVYHSMDLVKRLQIKIESYLSS